MGEFRACARRLKPVPAMYALRMEEIGLGLLVVGVLLIADPERLQNAIDRVRELLVWLAE